MSKYNQPSLRRFITSCIDKTTKIHRELACEFVYGRDTVKTRLSKKEIAAFKRTLRLLTQTRESLLSLREIVCCELKTKTT